MTDQERGARELLARLSPHYQDPKGGIFLPFGREEWVEVSAAVEALTEQSATIDRLREALEFIRDKCEGAEMGRGTMENRVALTYQKCVEALSALPEQAGVSDRAMLDWMDTKARRREVRLEVGTGMKHATVREAITAAMQAAGAALGAAKGAKDDK